MSPCKRYMNRKKHLGMLNLRYHISLQMYRMSSSFCGQKVLILCVSVTWVLLGNMSFHETHTMFVTGLVNWKTKESWLIYFLFLFFLHSSLKFLNYESLSAFSSVICNSQKQLFDCIVRPVLWDYLSTLLHSPLVEDQTNRDSWHGSNFKTPHPDLQISGKMLIFLVVTNF